MRLPHNPLQHLRPISPNTKPRPPIDLFPFIVLFSVFWQIPVVPPFLNPVGEIQLAFCFTVILLRSVSPWGFQSWSLFRCSPPVRCTPKGSNLGFVDTHRAVLYLRLSCCVFLALVVFPRKCLTAPFRTVHLCLVQTQSSAIEL